MYRLAPSRALARHSRFLAILVLACAMVSAAACRREMSEVAYDGPWNLVLITFDTTRADRVSYAGHFRSTSPNLDALAAEGVAFANAYSVSSWTAPSHASILSGLYPSEHGCHADALAGEERPLPIREDVRLISEHLSDVGYECAGFTGGPFLDAAFGFSRGFSVWDDDLPDRGYRDAHEVNRAAFEWLRERKRADPFLLFLNYFDPHGPYRPNPDIDYPFEADESPEGAGRTVLGFSPTFIDRADEALEPTDREVEAILDLYDQEIYAADAALADLLAELEERGIRDRTILVVVGDHGEAFGERIRDEPVWGHGADPYESQCRVPLVIVHPGRESSSEPRTEGTQGARSLREERVSSIDLAATLLDAAEIEHEFPGRSLFAENPGSMAARHPVVAERYFPGHRAVGVWSGDYKLLSHTWPDREGSYERLSDLGIGGEERLFEPLKHGWRPEGARSAEVNEALDAVTRIREEFAKYVAERPGLAGDFRAVEEVGLDSGLRDRLRALGYSVGETGR